MIGELDNSFFSNDDKRRILSYLESDSPKNSIFDNSGIVREFEQELSAYHGKKYCLLTNSGTSALYSSYFALNLQPGDEVLVPILSFPATATPFLRLGVKVVFVDIDKKTYNIDLNDARKHITNKTKAVAYTNMWGHPLDPRELLKFKQETNLSIIEDNSLSLCSSFSGILSGTLSDISAFSLGSTKLFSGGQCGALITDNREFYERALLLGHFGQRAVLGCKNKSNLNVAWTGLGMNFRVNPLSAVVSQGRFGKRKQLIKNRHDRFKIVLELCSEIPWLYAPWTHSDVNRGIWQGLVLNFEGSHLSFHQRLASRIEEYRLPIKMGFYYKPLSSSPLLNENIGNSVFSSCNSVKNNVLSFPNFSTEPVQDVELFASQVLDVFKDI